MPSPDIATTVKLVRWALHFTDGKPATIMQIGCLVEQATTGQLSGPSIIAELDALRTHLRLIKQDPETRRRITKYRRLLRPQQLAWLPRVTWQRISPDFRAALDAYLKPVVSASGAFFDFQMFEKFTTEILAYQDYGTRLIVMQDFRCGYALEILSLDGVFSDSAKIDLVHQVNTELGKEVVRSFERGACITRKGKRSAKDRL